MEWIVLGNGIPFRGGGGKQWQTYWLTREPSGIAVTITGATTATVTWTDSLVLGADGYKVYEGATLKNTVNVGVQAANVTGLTANTLYTFKVVAYKGTNESTGVTTNATTWTLGESVIRTSNTVAWYDVMDLSTITKDGADRVSEWADKLGSGNNIVQANGAFQPLWASGEISFDGTDEYLRGGFVYTAPTSWYLVLKQISWTLLERICDGAADQSHALNQTGSSPRLQHRLSSFNGAATDGCTIGNWKLLTSLVRDGQQYICTNNNQFSDTDIGSAPPSLAGFNMGARGSLASFANVAFAEAVLRSGYDSDADRDAIQNYLIAKYGL